jgi:hypothetical protein
MGAKHNEFINFNPGFGLAIFRFLSSNKIRCGAASRLGLLKVKNGVFNSAVWSGPRFNSNVPIFNSSDISVFNVVRRPKA